MASISNTWNNDLELTFLEMYQKERIIWDPKHPNHKDKQRVYDAWTRLSKEMMMPIEALKKKKESLMATYRGIVRKIKSATLAGTPPDEGYRPSWFAYALMNSFLPNTGEHNSKNADTQNSNGTIVEEEEVVNEPSLVSVPVSTSTQERTRKRKVPEGLLEAEKSMRQAIALLNKVIHDKEAVEDDDDGDDCDLYGKLLAKKLRRLPEGQRNLAMHEIDGTLLRIIYNDQQETS